MIHKKFKVKPFPNKGRRFPAGFLWGAATSAYQVEGNNKNSDWAPWEKSAGKELCADACRHYDFFERDFDLAKKLNHNAHRLSIEWARIEPREGEFSKKELNHYRQVIKALRKRNIEPIATLHHFTNPLWVSEKGGWTKPHTVNAFLRYCDFVVRGLAKEVRYWITINEPTIYFSHAYILGVWPPQEKSYVKAAQVEEHLASAHVQTYQLIHKVYGELNLPKPMVSISQHVIAIVPCRKEFRNIFAAYLRDRLYNYGFIQRIMPHLDFLGVNYYSRQVVELKKLGLENLAWDVCDKAHHRVKKNSLGWDIYPQGLYHLLLGLREFRRPIMITENGICTSDDNLRWNYIRDHLSSVHRAMKKGVNVLGYLYWSLLDNFEWDKGFAPRFGLIDVNYKTFKRTVRNSAKKFAVVCQTGILR